MVAHLSSEAACAGGSLPMLPVAVA